MSSPSRAESRALQLGQVALSWGLSKTLTLITGSLAPQPGHSKLLLASMPPNMARRSEPRLTLRTLIVSIAEMILLPPASQWARLIRCLAVGALFANSFGARAQSAGIESAMESYVACLIQAAEEMDDRGSEASSIARAIIPVCSLKFQEVKRTVEREAPTRQERAQLLQNIDQRQMESPPSALQGGPNQIWKERKPG
jgi:hypothetical protein